VRLALRVRQVLTLSSIVVSNVPPAVTLKALHFACKMYWWVLYDSKNKQLLFQHLPIIICNGAFFWGGGGCLELNI
jgi:hypothetical protein